MCIFWYKKELPCYGRSRIFCIFVTHGSPFLATFNFLFSKIEKGVYFFFRLCYNILYAEAYICPWRSWIACKTPTLEVEGSNPFGQAKKKTKSIFDLAFFSYIRIAEEMHPCG